LKARHITSGFLKIKLGVICLDRTLYKIAAKLTDIEFSGNVCYKADMSNWRPHCLFKATRKCRNDFLNIYISGVARNFPWGGAIRQFWIKKPYKYATF